jgi:hypothetical protein
MTDSYGYDTNGLFASYTAKFSGAALYAETVLRDAIGRITQKTETVQGTTHVWGYTFDATGRLTHPAPTRDLPRGRGLPDAYEIAT